MNNYLETIGLLKIKKMNYGMVRITYKSDEFQWWNLPTFFITSRHDLSECKYGPIFIIGGYYWSSIIIELEWKPQ